MKLRRRRCDRPCLVPGTHWHGPRNGAEEIRQFDGGQRTMKVIEDRLGSGVHIAVVQGLTDVAHYDKVRRTTLDT
jgi:hypothetical protein